MKILVLLTLSNKSLEEEAITLKEEIEDYIPLYQMVRQT